MSIQLSTQKNMKLGYGSEPTPNSVKEHVTAIEAAIIKEIGEFTPFSSNKSHYKEILKSIQEDLKTVRPIIEYVQANGGQRAFKESNIKDTYDRYEELNGLVNGDGAPADAEAAAPEENPLAGAGSDAPPETGEEPLAEDPLSDSGAEALLNAMSNAVLIKNAIAAMDTAATPPTGLANKIEKLYFLGRIDDLESIKEKTARVIRIGELLASAINNDGRPTLAAISELNQACQAALVDISVIESAVEALNHLPDKLESLVDLLKISLLERIKEIKGAE